MHFKRSYRMSPQHASGHSHNRKRYSPKNQNTIEQVILNKEVYMNVCSYGLSSKETAFQRGDRKITLFWYIILVFEKTVCLSRY